jgi:hypothetical protein
MFEELIRNSAILGLRRSAKRFTGGTASAAWYTPFPRPNFRVRRVQLVEQRLGVSQISLRKARGADIKR